MDIIQYHIDSPCGSLYLVASDKGLRGIHWRKQPGPVIQTLNSAKPAHKILNITALQLREYFAGQRKNFDVPLDLDWGSSFQRRVWKELSRIPFGQTASYKDIAKRINNPKAVRAVGSANGRNPFSIIVPCHRVIAADGSMGGYGGGLPAKRVLLTLENKHAMTKI